MSENAEVQQPESGGSRSAVLLLLSVAAMLLLVTIVSDQIPAPGTYSRQLLLFGGRSDAVGWGAGGELARLQPDRGVFSFLFETIESSLNLTLAVGIALGMATVGSVLMAHAMIARVARLPASALFGAAVFALLLYSAPLRAGTVASGFFVPIVMLSVAARSPCLGALSAAFWVVWMGDFLAPVVVTTACALIERRQSLLARFAPMCAAIVCVALFPSLRFQLRGSLSAVLASGPNSLALELLGWSAPDLHQHMLAPLAIVGFFLIRARSQRPLSNADNYALVASGCYLLGAIMLPFFAAGMALAYAVEANSWEERGGRRLSSLWQGSVFAICSSLTVLFAVQIGHGNAPKKERDIIIQLRPPLGKLQQRGPLFSDVRFGAALLTAGISPFVDARVAPYAFPSPKSVTGSPFSDYEELIKLRPRWAEVLSRYDFQLALLPRESSLAGVLQARFGWKEVAVSEQWWEQERGMRKPRHLALLVTPD